MSTPTTLKRGTLNETCQHPVGHRHGTRVCYVADRCRCEGCTDANRRAARERYRRRASEAWDPDSSKYVDAEPVRAHLRSVQRAGLGYKEIARRANLHPFHIYQILWGRPDRHGGKPRARITRIVAAKILAVEVPETSQLMPGAKIDATLARDRLRSLVRLGWSVPQLAAHSGCNRQLVDCLILDHRDATTVKSARAIAATYFALRDHEPHAHAPHEKAAISRARNRARLAGWPNPYDVVAGPKSTDPYGADHDEFLFLVRGGEAPERAAHRLGVTLGAIERKARRKDRSDVLARILGDLP